MATFFRSLTLGTVLRALGIVLLVVLLGWYVHFQARFFLEGPIISLSDTGSVLHHEKEVHMTGTARNIVKLTMNGKEIHTTEDGVFKETLILENGYSITTLKAWDRFGRETEVVREFVYVPEKEGVY